MERLNNEKIIGNGSTNPFIASEANTNSPDAAPPKAEPARPSARAVPDKKDKAIAVDQAKLSRLTEALRQANATITGLDKQLSAVESEKSLLEQAIAHEKERVAEKEQAIARLKSQPEGSAQKLAVESLIATLPKPAGVDQQKYAELAEQLRNANVQRAELTKALSELQVQKNALDTQLSALKANNAQTIDVAKELDALKAQLSALNLQKATLETRLAEQEKVFSSEKTKSEIARNQLEHAKKVIASQESQLAGLKETREKNATLTKALADLQTQKNALDAQLATLKTSSDKSSGAVKEVDALKSQLSALNLQKATLETRMAEQEKQLKSEKFKVDIAQNQLEDAKKVIASQESLLALQKNNVGSEKDKSGALVAQLATAGKETAELKKQLALLQTQKASLEEQQKTQSASLATLTAENQKLKESQSAPAKEGADKQRMKIDKAAAKDTLTSYAIGTWYGDAAGREKSKLDGLNKKLDLNAFMQGFDDKVNNKLQLTPAALSKELAALDQVQKKQFVATQSENEKQSKAIMTKAANEKGAKRLPDGAIYRVIQQGEAPLVTGKNEIITEIDEVLGTGKVMSSKEVRASRVKDLPPLFQTVVKKLGLGGEAKLHIPAKQAYGEAGVPGFVPPGTVSIITIKIIGIK
ncbi:FKBP-type peptidyl-prolyl cis-trans isomerase N-terminal domain-containing protein [Leclercia adecarboxylata]|uniref:FKBP-type peptidyl-prolyl cis-trans isomerase N-terminal domain-containing protein n=1 Tax=Leclercia adecarboxylata TaxID=83655 RepID=UPI00254E0C0D|nr:FKBP-type peptidyl-prolyl cis-trans isomerase N-terminal domain-containing protein [Leclercia adecarboxylata]